VKQHNNRLSKVEHLSNKYGGKRYVARWYSETAEQRFWKKVNKDGPIIKPELGPCWIWTGAKSEYGHGIFLFVMKPKKILGMAHRFAYETFVGPVPEGKELDHLCHNPPCVNPKHLEPVTHKTNVQRGLAGIINNHFAAKTHCPRGHEYTPENTYYDKHGRRACRTCHRVKSLLRLKELKNRNDYKSR
jgi:hypothetical protein